MTRAPFNAGLIQRHQTLLNIFRFRRPKTRSPRTTKFLGFPTSGAPKSNHLRISHSGAPTCYGGGGMKGCLPGTCMLDRVFRREPSTSAIHFNTIWIKLRKLKNIQNMLPVGIESGTPGASRWRLPVGGGGRQTQKVLILTFSILTKHKRSQT